MPTTITGTGGVSQVQDGAVKPEDLNGAQSGNAPIYGARAWVSFDPSKNASGGSDSANTNRFINASGNVTSVLKNATGEYTVTMTTAMPDINYVVSGSANRATASLLIVGPKPGTTYTTTTFVIQVADATPTLADGNLVNLVVFR